MGRSGEFLDWDKVWFQILYLQDTGTGPSSSGSSLSVKLNSSIIEAPGPRAENQCLPPESRGWGWG